MDFDDKNLDSTLFITDNSITFYEFLPADFNLDGIVDSTHLNILATNWLQTGKTFCEGDATFDGSSGMPVKSHGSTLNELYAVRIPSNAVAIASV